MIEKTTIHQQAEVLEIVEEVVRVNVIEDAEVDVAVSAELVIVELHLDEHKTDKKYNSIEKYVLFYFYV